MKNKKKIIIISSIIIASIVAIISLIFILNNKKEEEKINKLNEITKSPNVILREDGVARYVGEKEVTVEVKTENDVFEVIEEVGDYFRIDEPKSVLEIKTVRESNELKYYKLSQKYNGIKVYGNELIVTVNKENKVKSITGKYVPITNTSTYSSINIDEMEKNLSTILNEEYKLLEKSKTIYIKDGTPIYCYVYTLVTKDGINDVFIDAKESIVVEKISKSSSANYSYTGKDILGKEKTISINSMEIGGYQLKDNNRNISIVNATNIGVDIEMNENDLPKDWGTALTAAGHFELRQAPAVVTICGDGTLSTDVCITKDTNFIRSSISAMDNFSKAYDYYNDVLGNKSYDDNGAEIFVNIGVVNSLFGTEEYYNAFWNDGYKVFAFGSKNDITLAAALDVVAHEYTHAVSGSIVGLTYKNESGALNESYSDILGSLVEGENFQIGEEFGVWRDMTNPNQYGDPMVKGGKYHFPADTETYNEEWRTKLLANNSDITDWKEWDHGGVHTNSGIPNYAAFLMYDNGAFSSKEEMAKVWYNSLYLLSSNADFEDCALAVIEVARLLELKEEKIKIIEDAFKTTKMLDEEYGSLSGKVSSDLDSKPLEGAVVTAINQLNPHVYYQTTTNEDGKYNFEKLSAVEYEVTYEMPKYYNHEEKIKITNKKDYKLDVKLKKIEEANYEESEIVFVLDISKSMDESDPTNIRKQIINNIVSSLDDNSKVALVVFTGQAKQINNGLSSSSADKKILITDIFNMVNDSGHNDDSGTNGREGLGKALELFDKNSETRKYIVFLTDGEDNKFTGPTYDEIIKNSNDMGIRILTIALGQDDQVDTGVLINIASKTKGKYYHATKSTNLYEFDKRIFAELN